jgi:hypothetical protein
LPPIQLNGTTWNKKQFPRGIMGINDLPVVVFHQAIKEVEVIATEYEQPSCWYPISQIHDLGVKCFPLTRRIHTNDSGNRGDRFDHIAWLKLVANPSMFVLWIIIAPVVLSE